MENPTKAKPFVFDFDTVQPSTKRQKLSPEQSQALEQQQKQELAGKIAGLKAEIDYLQKRETGLKNLKQVVIGSNTSLEKGLAKEKMDPASDKRNLEAW